MIRFQSPAPALATAVQTVARAAARENFGGPPALTGILVEATVGEPLRLTATDLALAIRAELPCEVQESGRAVVPASLIADLAQRLPAAAKISVAIDEQADVTWARSHFHLPTLALHDYPELDFVGAETVTVSGDALRDLVRTVAHATASKDDGRIFTTAVYLQATDSYLIATTTDNHRLAWAKTPCTGDAAAQALVPAKALEDAVRILPDDNISVAFTEKHVCLRSGGTEVTLSSLRAVFPDPHRVMDIAEVASAECDADATLAAFQRLDVLTDKQPRVHLRFDDGAILLSLASDIGRAEEALAVTATGTPPELLDLGPRYVVDALKALGHGKVRIIVTGPESPLRIVRVGSEDVCAVVMPLRHTEAA